MGDANPICTHRDYSKPSNEGYRNTIELPLGNNVVPLRSDTILLVQNRCSFHGLRSEDPNQHLNDFLKLVDSLDIDSENRERTRLRLFQFSLRDQASNWLERLLAGSITTWEDLTTRFLAQLFSSMDSFQGLTPKVPHHGIDLWLQVQIFYDHVNPVTRRTIDQSAGGKLRDRNVEESWTLLEDLALYDNESWNDPRDFAKPVKAISLPQDVSSTSDCRLIELENQVQRLMEAHIAPTQPTKVNKITTSCEICSGPHDTQYCMEDPEQAFVEYASSCTDEAGCKWYTFRPEQNNLGDTYNPSWKSHPNLRWRQPQNFQNNFSNPPNRFQPNGSILNQPFNNNPRSFNNQSNLEGLVSNFMASQDARLSKFEADFKQQQSEMTNKIDTVLKAITDRIAGALPNDTVKNPKLSTSPVLSARSYPTKDLQCSTHIHGSINTITIHPKQQNDSHDNEPAESEEEEKDSPENTNTNPFASPDPSVSFITEKVRDDGDVIFIEIVKKNDDSRKEKPEAGGLKVEYFDTFLTLSELAYHKYLMCGHIPSIFLRNPIITEGCPSNLKIPCNIGHVHVEKAYIDLNSPLNIMTRMMYNWIMRRKLDPRENSNRGVSNFTGRIKGMHVFVRNFTYVTDFMIVEDISSIIDPRLSQVVLGKPFVDISNMTHDPPEGVVRFTNETDEIAYKMPHKIEQYNSLSDLEKSTRNRSTLGTRRTREEE
ncbi:MAK10-like protein [Tanacetum coccineum]